MIDHLVDKWVHIHLAGNNNVRLHVYGRLTKCQYPEHTYFIRYIDCDQWSDKSEEIVTLAFNSENICRIADNIIEIKI